jgi:uncharacterized protein (TIGR04255 family)
MADWPHLKNAPITEGLLDIRCTLPADVTLEDLAKFQEAIADRYPQRRERQVFESSLTLGTSEVVQKHQMDGYLFAGADGHRVVQARLDGFAFSVLKPYTSWPDLRDEAREHWARYRQIARPTAVSRVAVRFINRIELPLPFDDFREYVLTAPDIAAGLPQGLATFIMRLVIPVERANCVAIVTETIETAQGGRLPFILDIEAFTERPFKSEDEELWQTLDRLREVKNDFFFRSITPKTLELLK